MKQRPTQILMLVILFLFFSCPFSKAQDDKISIVEFIEKPFGYTPSIENFRQHEQPKLKLQRYRFKKYESDTIYRFYRGSNQLFINKSRFDEIFMSGVIKSRRFEFNGGIQTGMKKEDFINSFTDTISDEGDTITFSSPDHANNYHFIFRHNRLKKVKIDNVKQRD